MTHHQSLGVLAAELRAQREALLQGWREAVDRDPLLTTASTITRSQFIDHIPEVLDAFERQLAASDSAQRAQAKADQSQGAAGHGLHRWSQGYHQRETMREWGHLHLLLLARIEAYGAAHPELPPAVLREARRELAELAHAGICESTERYAELRRQEAAARMAELERAIGELKILEGERARMLREATHDLRGRVSTITNVTRLLEREGLPEHSRAQFSQVLRRSVTSLEAMLTELMDLARLEAGQEKRHLTHFNAARLLQEFGSSMRPLAQERGLFLHCEGPDSLSVEGDATHIQRIAQNLVLNALKATDRGGIRLTWQEAGTDRRPQWLLCVQDTGAGFESDRATPVSLALKSVTEHAHESVPQSGLAQETPAPTLLSQSPPHPPEAGEGIGLAIVKRLCELLDASIELESAPGRGTTFRVIFPRTYAH